MKFRRKTVFIILILAVVGILFRGGIYRNMITYNSVGQRADYTAIDHKLVNYLDTNSKNLKDPEIRQIINLGLTLTSNQLNFTAQKNDIDPNKLITSRTAHCVGYAAFFSTTCNYLLDKYELSGNWIAKPQIGQLYFLGINIHKYFNSPFFKDHDFVIIENKMTGEKYAVDPTVWDYLKINFISY